MYGKALGTGERIGADYRPFHALVGYNHGTGLGVGRVRRQYRPGIGYPLVAGRPRPGHHRLAR